MAVWFCGCSTSGGERRANSRAFDFQRDTFAYANELVWEYHFGAQGNWMNRKPAPGYTHHCFVVARSARQFFEHSRFAPERPVADAATYARLIDRVVSGSPNRTFAEDRKVVIPGYANLREFSIAHAPLLQRECGSAWQSYFQRGHWRMTIPFSRHHQASEAEKLIAAIRENHPPVVHLVRFPQLTINHAMLFFGFEETDREIKFTAYDPNHPDAPTVVTFDRASRTYLLPVSDYFPGGRVDVYQVYYGWFY